MQYQRWIAPLFFTAYSLVYAGPARGGTGGALTGSVHVHIVFAQRPSAGPNLQVRLMEGSSSTPIATTYTNSNGQAEFGRVRVGDYHVVVSGEGIQTTESGLFEVDERKVTQAQYITVRRSRAIPGPKPDGSKSSMVSASELNVPAKARKELDKANEAMAHRDWKKALERLNKAIAIDPRYAVAYNNLGVLYGRMNDDAHEREALEKAISLDDHLAAAYVNLAKLCLREKNFPKAETLLEKAVSVDPNNVGEPDAAGGCSVYGPPLRRRHRQRSRSPCFGDYSSGIRALHSGPRLRHGEPAGGGAWRITDISEGGAHRTARRSCPRRHSSSAAAGAIDR